MTRNDQDAQDIVQEAYLRAFKFFPGFRGVSPRAWMLAIVRNTFHTWREKNQRRSDFVALDDAYDEGTLVAERTLQEDETPLTAILRRVTGEEIDAAIASLTLEHREVFILREMEELSYKEIAEIAQIPLGTVMSRLARARQHLRRSLERTKQGST